MKRHRYNLRMIIAAGLSLATIVGCKHQDSVSVDKQVNRLDFAVTLDSAAIATTRATRVSKRSYSGDINFASSGFKAVGYRTLGNFAGDASSVPNLFNWIDPDKISPVINVKKDVGESNPNKQYYTGLPASPLSDAHMLSFFAWSSSIEGSITKSTTTRKDTGSPWFEVKVGAVNTPQPDIVGALALNYSADYVTSAVDFDFKHLLSKVSFRVRSANGASGVIKSVECIYGAESIYSEGRFEFSNYKDVNVGFWSELKSYLAGGSVLADGWACNYGAEAVDLGSMVFIPQELSSKAIALKIKYTTLHGGAESPVITRTVSLKALRMDPGKNYVYDLDMSANAIDVLNVKVEGWVSMSGNANGLPLIPGKMDANIPLLLEGSDAPYVTADGRKFWLDRSGWNNHCQIMDKSQYGSTGAFDITYDPTVKGYLFPTTSFSNGNSLYNHIQIPDLGTINGNFTYELVCTQTATSSGDPYGFILSQAAPMSYGSNVTSNSLFYPDIAYGTTKFGWRYNGAAESPNIEIGTFVYNKRSYYYGTRSTSTSKIVVGLDDTHSNNTTSIVAASNGTKSIKCGYIGPKFAGVVNYLRISKSALSSSALTTNYERLAKDYDIVPTKYTISYNANGGSGAPSSGEVVIGNNYTVSSTKPTRTDYLFKGWNTAADGTGTTYQPGATISNVTNHITLYAVWFYLPEGSYIPRDVLARAGWPTDRLPEIGLQLATIGNNLPGEEPAANDRHQALSNSPGTTFGGTANVAGLGQGKSNSVRMSSSFIMGTLVGCRKIGSEWYISSKDELNLIVNNNKLLGSSYLLSNAQYWCSTYSHQNSIMQYFFLINGSTGAVGTKQTSGITSYFRCVREI